MASKYYWSFNDQGDPLAYQGLASDFLGWLGVMNSNPTESGGNLSTADIAGIFNKRYGLNLTHDQWSDLLANNYLGPERELFWQSAADVDMARLDADVAQMLEALEEESKLEKPLLQDFLDDARAQVAAENEAEFAEMDDMLEQQHDLYSSELKGLGANYNLARSNLLSQQYQQNAQLMDSLQSGMERSRRNALEAGASAGIRIADNINTLLSVQNKQSASAMETANQLSQMMINQRNAEAATRRDYSSYLQSDLAERRGMRQSAEGRASERANTNYTAADQAYLKREQDFTNKYQWNPLYDYRSQFDNSNKSKYSGGSRR